MKFLTIVICWLLLTAKFAREIELSPSHLSDLLNKKRGLSRQSVAPTVRWLKLKPDEIRVFLLSVQAHSARAKLQKKVGATPNC